MAVKSLTVSLEYSLTNIICQLKMDPNTIVLDIQCIKNNLNSIIIKEITAIHLESRT